MILKSGITYIVILLLYVSTTTANAQNTAMKTDAEKTEKTILSKDMLIRISEIEVVPQYLEEYLKFAKEVGATSVRKEKGVICIYPMVQKRNPYQVRILEIYADQDAYQSHIKSAHFQKYKTGTLHMVKSLDLVDMNALDPAAMNIIFKKIKL